MVTAARQDWVITWHVLVASLTPRWRAARGERSVNWVARLLGCGVINRLQWGVGKLGCGVGKFEHCGVRIEIAEQQCCH